MDLRNIFLVQAFLLAAVFTAGETAILKCYTCDSTNVNCRDPFVKSPSLVPTECSLKNMPGIPSDILATEKDSNIKWSCMKAELVDEFGNIQFLRGCRQKGSEVAALDVCKKPGGIFKVTYCDSCEGEACNGAYRLSGISVLFYLLVPCLVFLKAIAGRFA